MPQICNKRIKLEKMLVKFMLQKKVLKRCAILYKLKMNIHKVLEGNEAHISKYTYL